MIAPNVLPGMYGIGAQIKAAAIKSKIPCFWGVSNLFILGLRRSYLKNYLRIQAYKFI